MLVGRNIGCMFNIAFLRGKVVKISGQNLCNSTADSKGKFPFCFETAELPFLKALFSNLMILLKSNIQMHPFI